MSKIWAFKYRDTYTIVATPMTNAVTGEPINEKKPAHAPLEYIMIQENEVNCFIYTDTEIEGLELVATNVEVGQ